jgi:methylated-DNA-protein-cysteine methyltransferase-like protein
VEARDTRFFERVYAAVRAIPRGRVATYGEVARLLGVPRGARAVGWALGALSATRERRVPWHRVVGAGGRISLRDGVGPEVQRRRLKGEGVRFLAGRVDLARHGMDRPAAPRAGSPAAARGSRGRAAS